jgi:hypothetical protein
MLAGGLALLVTLAGCGRGHYPVHGKVTFPDGTPLTEGLVMFETSGAGDGMPVSARGEIQADGRFELSTHKPGDGVPPGTYRVLISPKKDPNAVDKKTAPPPFDQKFTSFATSQLTFEVKPQDNDCPITVTKPKK